MKTDFLNRRKRSHKTTYKQYESMIHSPSRSSARARVSAPPTRLLAFSKYFTIGYSFLSNTQSTFFFTTYLQILCCVRFASRGTRYSKYWTVNTTFSEGHAYWAMTSPSSAVWPFSVTELSSVTSPSEEYRSQEYFQDIGHSFHSFPSSSDCQFPFGSPLTRVSFVTSPSWLRFMTSRLA